MTWTGTTQVCILLLFWINPTVGFFTPRIFWNKLSSDILHRQRKGLFGERQDVDDDLNSQPTDANSGEKQLITRRNILTGVIGGTLSIPLILEGYARSGKIQSEIDNGFGLNFENGNGTSEITIIFHGAGGEDANTDELLNTLIAMSGDDLNKIIRMVNWEADSADILQASAKGSKIGKQLAISLLEQYRSNIGSNSGSTNLKVHVIGISVGAFAADSFVRALNEDSISRPGERDNIYLQLTLLDPFQQKAVLGLGYGNQMFGKGADYAQQYLNTDDPVPSTNAPLDHCATIDVTSLRPEEVFGHDWPLIYYTQKLQEHQSEEFIPVQKRKTIGSVEVIQA